jgi:hypothetical protein
MESSYGDVAEWDLTRVYRNPVADPISEIGELSTENATLKAKG